MSTDFSVVVPVYNSAETLRELYVRIADLFQQMHKSFEVVFVDDKSLDNSWEVICELKQEFKYKVRAIHLAKNAGQQNATLCGIQNCSGNLIVTIDDDLQVPPEEIPKLVECMEKTDADFVYGIFDAKRHSLIRNIGSRFFNAFFKLIASTSGKGSSFRLLKRSLTEKIKDVGHDYFLLDEVLSWYTLDIEQQLVDHHQRGTGSSGYNTIRLIKMSMNYTFNYSAFPLRMMTYFGFFVSLIFFGIGLYFIYQKFYEDVELGFTSIIVSIFLSAGIILFCMGIIGEYISRIYLKEHKRPPYVIKKFLE
ncbi:MAG: glycosyltransferase family 2 protein [Chitinophagales bacterium]